MAADIRELLDVCEQLETRVAALYHFFAELYADMPELAALWRKTASEEENHMLQFRLAYRLESIVSLQPLVEVAAVRQTLDRVTELLDKVRQTPPSWQSALRLAIEMEDKLVSLHATTAMSFAEASMNGLFKSMMAHDQQHVQALSNFLAESGKKSP
jgi:rubrerythrin